MSPSDSAQAVVATYARISPSYDSWSREAPFLINCHRTYDKVLKIIAARGRYRQVLDLGCGTGLQTQFLASIADQVMGIDISADLIRQARERCSHLPNTSFQIEDARRLPFPDRSFDAVVSYGDVLSHIIDGYEDVISELGRVTMPGGLISFEVDNKWTIGLAYQPAELWTAVTTRGGYDTRMWEGMRFKTFTRPEITKLLDRHGFKILHVHSHNILASIVPDQYGLEQGQRSTRGRIALALGEVDLALSNVFPFNRFGFNLIVTAVRK